MYKKINFLLVPAKIKCTRLRPRTFYSSLEPVKSLKCYTLYIVKHICFTVMIFLIMTSYQLHETFSGFKRWPRRQHSGAEETFTNSTDCTFSWEGRTPCCTVCTQWQGNTVAQIVHFLCSGSANKQMQQQQPNHAWGTVWLYSGMQPLADRPQGGQFLVELFYSRAKHTHSVWVRCPGMVKHVISYLIVGPLWNGVYCGNLTLRRPG